MCKMMVKTGRSSQYDVMRRVYRTLVLFSFCYAGKEPTEMMFFFF